MKLLRTSIVVGFLGLILVILLYFGILRFNYPSFDKYPVRGLDISHHQGDINWDLLQKDQFKFIFIKATEGADFKDKRFQDNWSNAIDNNFDVGAYHFYRLCVPGDIQADNFISIVPKLDKSLPCVVDLEFGGNCELNYSKDELNEQINIFLNKVNSYYCKKPIIYTTNKFYREFLMDSFSEYDIWIRNIFTIPRLPANRSWKFWQFTNRGRVDGIDNYVDINVFNGSYQSYSNYVR